MKKVLIVLLLFMLVTTSCYALSLTEIIFYKKVFLNLVKRTVLVHRITGEVKYILTQQGTWVALEGALRNQYQSIYNVQVNGR